MSSKKNIVILGAGFAGTSIAHHILQNVLPVLSKNAFKVTLVNPSEKALNPVPGPRGIVSSTEMPQKNFIFPIADLFGKYAASQFTFKHAKVVGIKLSERLVELETPVTGRIFSMPYHALIIATGARMSSPTFSVHTNAADHEALLKRTEAALATAQTVLVAGGGPVGVETAGEIGHHLNGRAGWFRDAPASPKAKVSLYSGGSSLLPRLRPAIAAEAERQLRGVGVETVHGIRVVSANPQEAAALDDFGDQKKNTKTKVELSNGTSVLVDVYIQATGATPSTDWAPTDLLNDAGKVSNNPKTLRVDLPRAGPRVYALGDVGAHTVGGVMDVFSAVPVVGTNLKNDLLIADDNDSSSSSSVEKNNPSSSVGDKDREWKPVPFETQIVPVGKSGGVGAAFGWRLPSFMIWFMKSRDYMAGMSQKAFDGRKWAGTAL